MVDGEKLTSEQKAAAVIVSLGVDKASQIYKFLGQDDLEHLTIEVAKLGHLKAEVTEDILDEFDHILGRDKNADSDEKNGTQAN